METFFKKDDWVVIVNLGQANQYDGKIGHVYQIHRTSDSGFHYATEETDFKGSCLPDNCLRLALPEEIPLKYRKEPVVINNYELY